MALWGTVADFFSTPRVSGADFAVSQAPNNPNEYEVRYHISPHVDGGGLNNTVPDTAMYSLMSIQGNGTIFNKPSPMNGPSLFAGESIPTFAIIDPAGQITFGTSLGGTTEGGVDPNAALASIVGGPF